MSHTLLVALELLNLSIESWLMTDVLKTNCGKDISSKENCGSFLFAFNFVICTNFVVF